MKKTSNQQPTSDHDQQDAQDHQDVQENQDFYEAMPGTAESLRYDPAAHPMDEDEPATKAERRSILPWLLIPLAALLGLALMSALFSGGSSDNNSTDSDLQRNQ